MNKKITILWIFLCCCVLPNIAQKTQKDKIINKKAIINVKDTAMLYDNSYQSIAFKDSIWVPNSTKSLWYAVAVPGMGQIYNKKYWKLPIVYGGFAAILYAISWNGRYYSDYSNAYRDYMDKNPNSNRYIDLIPSGYPESQIESYLEKQQNMFRRNRDFSIILGLGFYAITVIDAFVDAELATFDISSDLSMQIVPAQLYNPESPYGAWGCGISLNF